MRVGLVTPRYPPNIAGGGEVSAQLLAEQLVGADAIKDVVVLSFDGDERTTLNGVTVRRLGNVPSFITEWQNIRAYLSLRSVIDDFDVVHAYNMELNPAVGLLTYRRSIPSVATLNSYHFFPKSVSNVAPSRLERLYELIGHPTTGRVMLRTMKRFDAFIALSSAVRDVYDNRGFDPTKIEVVPNMIDPDFDSPDNTAQSEPGVTLLYVGSLRPNKGVEYLVRAMDNLPNTYVLRVVGDGPMRASLEELAVSLGVSDRVTFTGQLAYERIPEQYATSDIFVHPGVWPEPFGRTVLEAMQSGLPVVCTDIGGPADLVRDDTLLCSSRDPEGLAESIEQASESARDIGRRNRNHVHHQYAPATVISRVLAVYDSVVD